VPSPTVPPDGTTPTETVTAAALMLHSEKLATLTREDAGTV
jgi:hypothetical protein